MCGILGQISQKPIAPSEFGAMLDTLAMRGPDGRGVKLFEGGCVALGHRRLSIIDLSDAGSQPMSNEDGTIWLTYNGEIYNFKELRAQLISAGHQFRSQSDSETIIHAYEQWGDDCVEHLRGIFAFAIWDQPRSRLFLARDRIGVKPLYYWNGPGDFIFASQPRAILKSGKFKPAIDPEAMGLYFAYGYIPGRRAAYAQMERLEAGCVLIYSRGSVREHRYWKPVVRHQRIDEVEAQELVRRKLSEAVRMQQVSDVPIGVFLSGGIDSSIVAAEACSASSERIHSFTIGFEDAEEDEREYARLVARHFQTIHCEEILQADLLEHLIPDFVETYDEPFSDNSGLPTLMVSRLVQRHKIKVILSGDGGDETFAGYNRYDWYHQKMFRPRQASRRARLSDGILRLVRAVRRRDAQERVAAYFPYVGYYGTTEQEEILTSDVLVALGDHLRPLREAFVSGQTHVRTAQLLDLRTYLVDDILTKVDRASMACGVEVRVPLLDHQVVELALSIDSDLVYANGERKALLKRSVAGRVPQEVLTSRKKGFTVPLATWMEEGLRAATKDLLRDGSLVSRGIIRPDVVAQFVSDCSPVQAWMLLVAELWARRWIEGSNVRRLLPEVCCP